MVRRGGGGKLIEKSITADREFGGFYFFNSHFKRRIVLRCNDLDFSGGIVGFNPP